MICPNKIRGDPVKATLPFIYPLSPEHQQTTCHYEFSSVAGMLWQHWKTKKVVHAAQPLTTLSLKHLSLEQLVRHIPIRTEIILIFRNGKPCVDYRAQSDMQMSLKRDSPIYFNFEHFIFKKHKK